MRWGTLRVLGEPRPLNNNRDSTAARCNPLPSRPPSASLTPYSLRAGKLCRWCWDRQRLARYGCFSCRVPRANANARPALSAHQGSSILAWPDGLVSTQLAWRYLLLSHSPRTTDTRWGCAAGQLYVDVVLRHAVRRHLHPRLIASPWCLSLELCTHARSEPLLLAGPVCVAPHPGLRLALKHTQWACIRRRCSINGFRRIATAMRAWLVVVA